MNRELGLRVLSQIMQWTDEEAEEEFRWLSFMSSYKFDAYGDYLAGSRFLENLSKWLQQFLEADRLIAYEFVKKKLIFFSSAEIQRLVENFFPEYVQPTLVKQVSRNIDKPKYKIWSTQTGILEYQAECRKTLFMGLSDGARIDAFRRINAGMVSNEQIVISTQTDEQKWNNLLEKLRGDLEKSHGSSKPDQKFSRVYLIDDFTASGTSFLRYNKQSAKFKGKLEKFQNSLGRVIQTLGCSPFVDDFDVIVHHYIGTEVAKLNMEQTWNHAKQEFSKNGVKSVKFSFGMLLPADICIEIDQSTPISVLC